MTSRAEHFQEAERKLRRSEESDPERARLLVAQAQVHATLANVSDTVAAGAHSPKLTGL